MSITFENQHRFDWISKQLEKYPNGLYFDDVESDIENDITHIYIEKKANNNNIIHAINSYNEIVLEKTLTEIKSSKIDNETGDVDSIDIEDAYEIIFDMLYEKFDINYELPSTQTIQFEQNFDTKETDDLDTEEDEEDIDIEEIQNEYNDINNNDDD